MSIPHLQFTLAGILPLAASIYGVLQAAKKAGLENFLSGRVGLAVGVATAFVSTIVIAGNLDANTLCAALVAALTAAGIHANLKTGITGSLASPTPGAGKGTAAAVVLLACLLPVGLSSCAVNQAEAGIPAATQNVQLASGMVDSIAHGLQLAQQSLETLHQAGTVTDAEFSALNADIQAVAVKNDAAITAVQAAEGSGAGTGWQASLQAVAAAAATLTPAEINIANATAKTTFTVALATFEAAVAAITAEAQ
jgi:hypothetical protein